MVDKDFWTNRISIQLTNTWRRGCLTDVDLRVVSVQNRIWHVMTCLQVRCRTDVDMSSLFYLSIDSVIITLGIWYRIYANLNVLEMSMQLTYLAYACYRFGIYSGTLLKVNKLYHHMLIQWHRKYTNVNMIDQYI